MIRCGTYGTIPSGEYGAIWYGKNERLERGGKYGTIRCGTVRISTVRNDTTVQCDTVRYIRRDTV